MSSATLEESRRSSIRRILLAFSGGIPRWLLDSKNLRSPLCRKLRIICHNCCHPYLCHNDSQALTASPALRAPSGCSRFAPVTPRNRVKQEQERSINRKRRIACPQQAFPTRSEGYRSWPSCTHNPKVAGSNPAPRNHRQDEGLAVSPLAPLSFLSPF